MTRTRSRPCADNCCLDRNDFTQRRKWVHTRFPWSRTIAIIILPACSSPHLTTLSLSLSLESSSISPRWRVTRHKHRITPPEISSAQSRLVILHLYARYIARHSALTRRSHFPLSLVAPLRRDGARGGLPPRVEERDGAVLAVRVITCNYRYNYYVSSVTRYLLRGYVPENEQRNERSPGDENIYRVNALAFLLLLLHLSRGYSLAPYSSISFFPHLLLPPSFLRLKK